MKVSIIIPSYNEERRIGKTLEEYCRFFGGKINFEIVVVLNACKDNTIGVVKKYQKRFKQIRFLNFEQGGKGFAITEGFKDALNRKNDLIGFIDADLATSPEAFYDLVKNIGKNEGIIASRWLKGAKQNYALKRKITSRGFNFLVRIFFLLPYQDTQCGAKLFKRKVIQKITPELRLTEWAFDVNMLYLCKKEKFKIKEYPTVWEEKKESKLDLTKAPLQMFAGILRLRLIYSPFEKILRPVKVILKIGNKLLKSKNSCVLPTLKSVGLFGILG